MTLVWQFFQSYVVERWLWGMSMRQVLNGTADAQHLSGSGLRLFTLHFSFILLCQVETDMKQTYSYTASDYSAVRKSVFD